MTRSLRTEWAARYLALGLSVIALSGKTPNTRLHKHWKESALQGTPESDDDLDLIESFMDHPETTGVGILTGIPYVVVDVDGPEGAAQYVDLVGEAAFLGPSARWVAKTGRGLHLWYHAGLGTLRAHEDGFVGPPTIKLGSKLDLKGFGGYVAAPPSLHPDGHTYVWLVAPGAEAPHEAPEPLVRRIAKHNYNIASAMDAKAAMKRRWGPKWESGATVFYAQPGHDALIDGMRTAEEGNRNNYLHWAAATMAEEGASDELFEALAEVALEEGLIGVEVKRTIRSARQTHG